MQLSTIKLPRFLFGEEIKITFGVLQHYSSPIAKHCTFQDGKVFLCHSEDYKIRG
jgi:hypothetical protein